MPNPWILAARPKTLPAAAAPVVVGTAIAWADGASRILPPLACLLGALLLQIGANFANDLSDFRKGADGADRLGPTRVTAAGLLRPEQVRNGAIVAFALAVCVGVYLVIIGGWPIVAIGLSGIVAAVTYVGGPLPYGYRGLGEIFVFLYFGLAAVWGTVFVQLGRGTPATWWAGAAMGAVAAAVLVVNNVRDRDGDLRAGKRTLVAAYGRRFGVGMYAGFLGLAVVVAGVFAWANRSAVFLLPTLYAAYGAVTLVRRLRSDDGVALNPLLGRTASFGLRFAALMALAIIVSSTEVRESRQPQRYHYYYVVPEAEPSKFWPTVPVARPLVVSPSGSPFDLQRRMFGEGR